MGVGRYISYALVGIFAVTVLLNAKAGYRLALDFKSEMRFYRNAARVFVQKIKERLKRKSARIEQAKTKKPEKKDNPDSGGRRSSPVVARLSALASSVFFRSSKIYRLSLAARLWRISSRALENILKFYDPFTREHVAGLTELAGVAAGAWDLDYAGARLLRLAAQLHDLGKDINDYYYCIVTLPKKLDAADPDLKRLKNDHPSHSVKFLKAEGMDVPVELQLIIRYHHDVGSLLADKAYQNLPDHGKAMVRVTTERLQILDSIGGYSEVFRPSNWFDHIALNKDAIINGIKARYGREFKIDVDALVEKLLAHHEALVILRGNTRHQPALIGGFIKSWTEEPHRYHVNPFESLKDQIASLRHEKDLSGIKHVLTALVQPEFDEAVRGDAATEVLSGIGQAFLDNPFINLFVRGHLDHMSVRHTDSLFIKAFRRRAAEDAAFLLQTSFNRVSSPVKESLRLNTKIDRTKRLEEILVQFGFPREVIPAIIRKAWRQIPRQKALDTLEKLARQAQKRGVEISIDELSDMMIKSKRLGGELSAYWLNGSKRIEIRRCNGTA